MPVVRRRGAVRGRRPVVEGEVDDPEDDLRLGADGTASNNASSRNSLCWLRALAVYRSPRCDPVRPALPRFERITFGEIANASPVAVRLRVGEPIAQLVCFSMAQIGTPVEERTDMIDEYAGPVYPELDPQSDD
jgi:hypothetical protein